MNFGDERAPLEFTKVSSKTKLWVCPKCKLGRHVSLNTVGVICNGCRTYITSENALLDGEERMLSVPINEELIKQKGAMEKKAYAWRDEQIKKKKAGEMPSHEPR